MAKRPGFSGRVRSEKSLGQFAIAGGYLEFWGNWVPDDTPEQAAFRLMTVAGYVGDASVPLTLAQQIAIEDTELHFETQSDPDGVPWEDITLRHANWKEKHGFREDILQMEGNLMEAATSTRAWKVFPDALVFDPSELPLSTKPTKGVNYGAVHQRGFGAKGQGVLGGLKQIPQREFIGLTEDSATLISIAFRNWFAESQRVFQMPIPATPSSAFVKGASYSIMSFTRRGQPIVRTPRGPRFASWIG